MAILLAGILTKALVGPAETLLMMAGKQNICALLYAGALVANVGLNVLLIPRFGIEGAAVATATAMGVEAVLLHLAVRRSARHRPLSPSPARDRPERIKT
jgi:O-antigen/teichoic acid export membrane protein